jgi:hypothetical protein
MLVQLAPGEWQPLDKLTHAEVKFEHPSRHEDEHCSLCVAYIPSMVPRCKHVKGPIQGTDWCTRFDRKE